MKIYSNFCQYLFSLVFFSVCTSLFLSVAARCCLPLRSAQSGKRTIARNVELRIALVARLTRIIGKRRSLRETPKIIEKTCRVSKNIKKIYLSTQNLRSRITCQPKPITNHTKLWKLAKNQPEWGAAFGGAPWWGNFESNFPNLYDFYCCLADRKSET